ncbi:MAG: HAD family phosphatase [Candidatus Moranbacteria bacterium]|nr:HAD family phosphatase [Candidatus Moranbacteria bacterium]
MAIDSLIEEIFGRPIRAVIFDMDGVIIDSEPIHIQADTETFERHGLMVPPEAWNDILGMRSEDGLRVILDRYGTGTEDAGSVVDEKRTRYFELAEERLGLIPGVEAFVISCRDRSLKTAVATSGRSSYQIPFLERFGIRSLFDVVVTGDEVTNGKPHPEPYLLAASRLGIEPGSCLVIEDADNGIRSAKEAGCIVVGLASTMSKEILLSAGADYVIDGFRELMR